MLRIGLTTGQISPLRNTDTFVFLHCTVPIPKNVAGSQLLHVSLPHLKPPVQILCLGARTIIYQMRNIKFPFILYSEPPLKSLGINFTAHCAKPSCVEPIDVDYAHPRACNGNLSGSSWSLCFSCSRPRTMPVGLSALAEFSVICDLRSSPFAAWLGPLGRMPCFAFFVLEPPGTVHP